MKYHNTKIVLCGESFDSRAELKRYQELVLMLRAGVITNLQRQVKYELIPSQKLNKKVVERPLTYIADFVYEDSGKTVVEDVKGMKTKDYIIKRKLMLFLKGIKIAEV